jgi:hypothetical protein
MASGHVNRVKRPNTWLHRPMLQNVKKALANLEPSTHDPTATSARSIIPPRRVQKSLSTDSVGPRCSIAVRAGFSSKSRNICRITQVLFSPPRRAEGFS